MASIWDERFETAVVGYEEVWNVGAVTGGGSAFSPTILPPGATPVTWATQCGRWTFVAGQNCYIANSFTGQNIVYLAFDVNITDESLANGQVNLLSYAQDGSSVPLWTIFHAQDSFGNSDFIVNVYFDGTAQQVAIGSWPIATTKRFEIKWDNVADLYQVWVDGTSVASGSLTGTANTRTFNLLLMGTLSTLCQGASTVYMDLIRLDNAARASVDGVGGAAYQQQYRALVTE